LKLTLVGGLAVWLASIKGLVWANAVLAVLAVPGFSFHIWWCRKNGIELFRPEPRDRYYQLRGWTS
jgi:hypothetical protein